MRTIELMIVLMLFIASVGTSHAQRVSREEAAKRAWAHILKVDTNKDGKISKAEYLAIYKKGSSLPEKNFKKIDLDQDGFLTQAEYIKYFGKLK